MIKIAIAFLLMVPAICSAEYTMFTARGWVEVDNATLKNTINNFLVDRATMTKINDYIANRTLYEVGTGTPPVRGYRIEFCISMFKQRDRDTVENYLKNYVSNSHLTSAYVEIFDDNNDKVPGYSPPDTILRTVEK